MFIVPIAGWLIEKGHLSCKPLELFGKASFNIYLTQKFFYYGIDNLFDGHFVSNIWVQCLINIVICFAVGLIFYWIETPLTRKLLGLLKQKKPAAA